jgi:hypothetical protein
MTADTKYSFHLAETADDYHSIASIWPKARGSMTGGTCGGARLPVALQNGSLILTRTKKEKQLVGATILDLTSYAPSLFIPLFLVREDEDRPNVMRKQLELVIQTLLISNANRLLIMRTHSAEEERLFKEFNSVAEKHSLPVSVEGLGSVRDLFSDGRDVSLNALFIKDSERPDVRKHLMNATGTIADAVLRIAARTGDDPCSGCKESKEDKAETKDFSAKDDNLQFATKLTFEKTLGEVLFPIYDRLGIEHSVQQQSQPPI